jgi:L-seryl-tRNA(Ser) seleniumtransferase
MLTEALRVEVLSGSSQVGGGALPTERLPTRIISLVLSGLSAEQLGARLRQGEPPVLTRIHDQQVLIDVRTLLPGEEELVLQAVEGVLAGRPRGDGVKLK